MSRLEGSVAVAVATDEDGEWVLRRGDGMERALNVLWCLLTTLPNLNHSCACVCIIIIKKRVTAASFYHFIIDINLRRTSNRD